jgi:hypothetical protein
MLIFDKFSSFFNFDFFLIIREDDMPPSSRQRPFSPYDTTEFWKPKLHIDTICETLPYLSYLWGEETRLTFT